MKVMEKKKWHQVADMMKIPKAAQDRVTKLDDIYCKYLLPYDTLSHGKFLYFFFCFYHFAFIAQNREKLGPVVILKSPGVGLRPKVL